MWSSDRLARDRNLARQWLLLSVSSLVLSGGLALLLVVARTPWLDRLVGDPLFFKRALVVHVNLALVVWFYAFLAGLYSLLPRAGAPSPWAGVAPWVSWSGVVMLLLAAGRPGAAPVLSNYIPLVDHPLFVVGLALFGAGIALAILDSRLFPGLERGPSVVPFAEAARPGLRVAGVAFLFALLTFVCSRLTTSADLPAQSRAELWMWGGGHVLQFASEAAMVSVWLMLLDPLLPGAWVSRRVTSVLFGALLLPVMAAPLLALAGTSTPLSHSGFTRLMEWGIFPVVLIFLALCCRALVAAHRRRELPEGWKTDARFLGFVASALLTVLGFVLGAFIHGNNTLVPAHYHASIGAVTASFMAVTYSLLGPLGVEVPTSRLRRLAKWQPLLFGLGQAIFALGFALAGAHGMGRKAYGREQLVRTLPETVGLGVMGLGGLVAIVGGLAFLWIVIASVRSAAAKQREGLGSPQRRKTWVQEHRSLHFRN
jgi:hypothetical protein